jgi:hypothetical protein
MSMIHHYTTPPYTLALCPKCSRNALGQVPPGELLTMTGGLSLLVVVKTHKNNLMA